MRERKKEGGLFIKHEMHRHLKSFYLKQDNYSSSMIYHYSAYVMNNKRNY